MANEPEFQTNDAVTVRLYGTTGRVLGRSDNPAWADADGTEPVYRVQMDDDGREVKAGASSLEAVSTAPAATEAPAETAAAEAPAEEAAETPAEETAEAEAAPAEPVEASEPSA